MLRTGGQGVGTAHTPPGPMAPWLGRAPCRALGSQGEWQSGWENSQEVRYTGCLGSDTPGSSPGSLRAGLRTGKAWGEEEGKEGRSSVPAVGASLSRESPNRFRLEAGTCLLQNRVSQHAARGAQVCVRAAPGRLYNGVNQCRPSPGNKSKIFKK